MTTVHDSYSILNTNEKDLLTVQRFFILYIEIYTMLLLFIVFAFAAVAVFFFTFVLFCFASDFLRIPHLADH